MGLKISFYINFYKKDDLEVDFIACRGELIQEGRNEIKINKINK